MNLRVERFGPIERAEVSFGDLNILVGPQATGKSIFLQLYKLLQDRDAIHRRLKENDIHWRNSLESFLMLYFGEGMPAAYREGGTRIWWDGQQVNLTDYAQVKRGRKQRDEHVFYIPAQRVLSLREGQTRPFMDYQLGTPYVLREFSDQIHRLIQSEFADVDQLFPKTNRLRKEFRDLIEQAIFAGFRLKPSEESPAPRRIVLASDQGNALPYLVWSAGQREFTPLLLGLYWLLPPGKVSKRSVETVVIEEPEMGLHPQAIIAVMALLLELLKRGYRLCITTHSSQVLEVVWALRLFQRHGAEPLDVLRLLGLPSKPLTQELARRVLEADVRVYYFKRDGTTEDISELNPAAPSAAEWSWGGLIEFATRTNDLVAEVLARAENRNALTAVR